MYQMNKIKLKKRFSIISVFAMLFASCFSDEITITGYEGSFWNTGIMSSLDIPGKNWYNFEWWNELLVMATKLLAMAVEYLPIVVLILLLLACIRIIFNWDGKEWLKRIKYVIVWLGLTILVIYIINILTTIYFWHPVINIHLNRYL